MKEICIYPACIECAFSDFKSGEVIRVNRGIFDEIESMRVDQLACIHMPVCKLIQGQNRIEAGAER